MANLIAKAVAQLNDPIQTDGNGALVIDANNIQSEFCTQIGKTVLARKIIATNQDGQQFHLIVSARRIKNLTENGKESAENLANFVTSATALKLSFEHVDQKDIPDGVGIKPDQLFGSSVRKSPSIKDLFHDFASQAVSGVYQPRDGTIEKFGAIDQADVLATLLEQEPLEGAHNRLAFFGQQGEAGHDLIIATSNEQLALLMPTAVAFEFMTAWSRGRDG